MVNMFKKTYKIFAIIILTLSAIYLTGQLWFVEIAGRDLGYVWASFFPNNRVNIDDIRTGALSTPRRIITGGEDNIYTIIYNNLRESKQKRIADEINTSVSLVIQPVSPIEQWQNNISKLFEFSQIAGKYLDVLIIPQTHKFLKID